MKVKSATLGMMMVLLLLSASLLSGCITSDQKIVGIPGGEEVRGDFYREDNRAEISVPILNTYDEPKEVVVKFEVITPENERYSELDKIRLPENSQHEYSQEIYLPEDEEETEEFLAQIIVPEDDIGIVEIEGDQIKNEDDVLMNVTIANTNFDSEDVILKFEVITEEGNVESEMKEVTLPENSIDDYSQKMHVGETPENYTAKILE